MNPNVLMELITALKFNLYATQVRFTFMFFVGVNSFIQAILESCLYLYVQLM